MTTFTTTSEFHDKLESAWWDLMQGELGLAHDPLLRGIVECIAAWAPDSIFDRSGNLIQEQFNRKGDELETVTEDELAQRIVYALAVILDGSGRVGQ